MTGTTAAKAQTERTRKVNAQTALTAKSSVNEAHKTEAIATNVQTAKAAIGKAQMTKSQTDTTIVDKVSEAQTAKATTTKAQPIEATVAKSANTTASKAHHHTANSKSYQPTNRKPIKQIPSAVMKAPQGVVEVAALKMFIAGHMWHWIDEHSSDMIMLACFKLPQKYPQESWRASNMNKL